MRTVCDPVLSLLQSVAARLARLDGRDPTTDPLVQAAGHLASGPGDTAPQGRVPDPTPSCARLGLLLEARIAGDAGRMQRLHDRLSFSACDPRWAETLLDYVRNLGPDGRPHAVSHIRHAFLSDFVVLAPAATLRIGLISAWATGTAAARAVAGQLASHRPDAVIHLGDTYYAGTAEGCDANFLAPLRTALPEAQLFSMCGNHDVYSGSDGYYGLLKRIGQPASHFCLRSPDLSWQTLAADTGCTTETVRRGRRLDLDRAGRGALACR